MAKSPKTKVKSKRQRQDAVLEKINLNAAGIDVGADKHFVAVPADRAAKPVRSFRAFTCELYSLCDWLKECQVDTVVMESTGVYWIALFQVLEERGFHVKLVNARHARNLPGRKTDMLDCQWLQQLHTFGLLSGSFRPQDQICVLRSYLRQRESMVRDCNSLVQRMQKALTQMNIQLHRVLSDITGVSGMNILRAIIAGERDTLKLAQMKHPQANCLTINDTEEKDGLRGLRNRCLMFDDTEGEFGIDEHEQPQRISNEDAGEVRAGAGPRVQEPANWRGGGDVRLRPQARHQSVGATGSGARAQTQRPAVALYRRGAGGPQGDLAGE